MVDIAILVPTQTVLTDTKYSGYSAQAYIDAVQADLNYLDAIGGGKFLVTLKARLVARYRGTDGIFPGYIANDEMRRANKAVILYNFSNIEIEWMPGAVWDRSGDPIADENYAEASCTLYISKSKNIRLINPNMIGYQEDANLLNGIKAETSGDHIQINNGCDGIYIYNPTLQDGTTLLSVGQSKTSAHASLDPAIPPCKNIFVTDFDGRNGEHDIILFKAYGVFINGAKCRVFTRSDGSTGVKQRGLYLHACKQVYINGIEFEGIFKTSILIANYGVVEDVYINGMTVNGMMTPASVEAYGATFSEKYEGHAISVQSDNCKNININGLSIKGVSSGIVFPGFGHGLISVSNGTIDAVFAAVYTFSSWLPIGTGTTVDRPAKGLTLRNLRMNVTRDDESYSPVSPNSGLLIQSFATDGSSNPIYLQDLVLDNVVVTSPNRNARVYNCSGFISDCVFTQKQTEAIAGDRMFDFVYTGDVRLRDIQYGNDGRPNGGINDTPAANLIRGYAELETRLTSITANTTFVVPPGYAIEEVFVANTTANAVTGGLKFGTTSGATDVIAAYAVAANQLGKIPDAQLLKSIFSLTAVQTIFIQPVTAWNSASLSITARLRKVV